MPERQEVLKRQESFEEKYQYYQATQTARRQDGYKRGMIITGCYTECTNIFGP